MKNPKVYLRLIFNAFKLRLKSPSQSLLKNRVDFVSILMFGL